MQIACTYVSAEDLVGKRTEAHRQRIKTIGVKKIMALAEKGDAAAQYDLGMLYNSGEFGVEKNQEQSFLWQKKSAEQGYALAYSRVAGHYYWAIGTKENHQESFKWWSKAANAGKCHVAETMLGDAYIWGKETKKDPVEALKWFRKSAAANRCLGLSGLAYMYRMGVGVEKDSVVAASLYSFAIEQGYGNYGHPGPVIELGEMYEKGEGVVKNLKKAVSLYIKAYEMTDTLGHKETKERAKQILDKAKSN